MAEAPSLAHSFGMAPPPDLPPRVLLVMSEQSPRALLRAALREGGYDASGTRDLKGALHQATLDPTRGPLRAVVIDHQSVGETESTHLEELQRDAPGVATILLARATQRTPAGPWTRIMRRPVRIGEVVEAIEAHVPLPSGARRPLD
jgi:DNA-binding NtrC family response regulator